METEQTNIEHRTLEIYERGEELSASMMYTRRFVSTTHPLAQPRCSNHSNVLLSGRTTPVHTVHMPAAAACGTKRKYPRAFSAPHQALALMWCCSSFEVEWVGVRGLERW
eukprot:gene16094-biopygen15789